MSKLKRLNFDQITVSPLLPVIALAVYMTVFAFAVVTAAVRALEWKCRSFEKKFTHLQMRSSIHMRRKFIYMIFVQKKNHSFARDVIHSHYRDIHYTKEIFYSQETSLIQKSGELVINLQVRSFNSKDSFHLQYKVFHSQEWSFIYNLANLIQKKGHRLQWRSFYSEEKSFIWEIISFAREPINFQARQCFIQKIGNSFTWWANSLTIMQKLIHSEDSWFIYKRAHLFTIKNLIETSEPWQCSACRCRGPRARTRPPWWGTRSRASRGGARAAPASSCA